MKKETKSSLPPQLESQLNRIASAPPDPLSTVLDTDPSTYATSELLALYDQWQKQQKAIKTMYKQLFQLVAIAPLWFVIGYLAARFQWGYGVGQLVLLFPISVVGFLLGLLYLYLRYGSDTQRQTIGDRLNDELQWRRFKQQQDLL